MLLMPLQGAALPLLRAPLKKAALLAPRSAMMEGWTMRSLTLTERRSLLSTRWRRFWCVQAMQHSSELSAFTAMRRLAMFPMRLARSMGSSMLLLSHQQKERMMLATNWPHLLLRWPRLQTPQGLWQRAMLCLV